MLKKENFIDMHDSLQIRHNAAEEKKGERAGNLIA
jgi:hypothetical protein